MRYCIERCATSVDHPSRIGLPATNGDKQVEYTNTSIPFSVMYLEHIVVRHSLKLDPVSGPRRADLAAQF